MEKNSKIYVAGHLASSVVANAEQLVSDHP